MGYIRHIYYGRLACVFEFVFRGNYLESDIMATHPGKAGARMESLECCALV